MSSFFYQLGSSFYSLALLLSAWLFFYQPTDENN
jgi:hypothetical protein